MPKRGIRAAVMSRSRQARRTFGQKFFERSARRVKHCVHRAVRRSFSASTRGHRALVVSGGPSSGPSENKAGTSSSRIRRGRQLAGGAGDTGGFAISAS